MAVCYSHVKSRVGSSSQRARDVRNSVHHNFKFELTVWQLEKAFAGPSGLSETQGCLVCSPSMLEVLLAKQPSIVAQSNRFLAAQ